MPIAFAAFAGVPPFFAHLPVLGSLLRRISLNAIQRLIEDIMYLTDKVSGLKVSIATCDRTCQPALGLLT